MFLSLLLRLFIQKLNFLSSEINDSFIIASTNKKEIYKIILSLNTNKYCRPNSIPTKVLHLLQDQISNYLAIFCNIILYRNFSCYSENSQSYFTFTKRILN